jgi:hypothetical protein
VWFLGAVETREFKCIQMYSIVVLSELIGLQVVLFPIVEYKYG